MPSLNHPNHVFDIYGESDSDVNYIADFSKEEDKRNSKEYDYTNRIEHNVISSQYPKKKGENEKALVTKEMGLGYLRKNLFICDSAATSHMMSRKLVVYTATETYPK